MKLPCRTVFPEIIRTRSGCPARLRRVRFLAQPRHQKKHVPLDMGRNGSPSLLIAVDGFDGRSEQLGRLFLGFSQLFSKYFKLFLIQIEFLSFLNGFSTIRFSDFQNDEFAKIWIHRMFRANYMLRCGIYVK
jgi:hypothetical protein